MFIFNKIPNLYMKNFSIVGPLCLFVGIFLVSFFNSNEAFGQGEEQRKIIQFSGVVTAEEGGEVVPLPYATIGVLGTRRGTISEYDGFFSLVVLAGEKVQIRSLGFETEEIIVPDTSTYFSLIITLVPEAIDLPMIEILPIPSREFFKEEFLAMTPEDPLMEVARKNLAQGLLAEIGASLPPDGGETSRILLQQNAASYYSYGQFKPQNIFNPLAWKKFIDAWKRGDYKKKKKKDK